MQKGYLAIDIGASGGRHIFGWIENRTLKLEEIYRFENRMDVRDGKRLWDTERLFGEIVKGMKICGEKGRVPASVAIDTWAVDFVLLDEKDRILGDTYAYRDSRTEGMDAEVYKILPEQELYARTGIQKQMFNTIYQLMAVKKKTPELLEKAKTFLMLPDYFQYRLTGIKRSEYTNATSTQLVSPVTHQWDVELIGRLGYPREIFLPLQMPGQTLGALKDEIANEVGYRCEVMLCAGHDTASAVMAMPDTEGKGLYISSGTWSLMGIESPEAVCDEKSRLANFTNEGGYDLRFRYLKNIMGLWMIQSVRHELNDRYSFAQLCELAEEAKDFPSRVDVNDSVFLAPDSMIEALKGYCQRSGQRIPESVGELSAVIYRSLAECYGRTVKEIEANTGRVYHSIHVIGGGSHADYLNRLTAQATGKQVLAGPSEATATGNLLAQMIASGEFETLSQARACVKASFPVRLYEPSGR
ncbi:MAG: rhamnulokinase [Ruminococcaceae bacterium]|nr:rhamnulokinase [Oscillospiraceae bacterium]